MTYLLCPDKSCNLFDPATAICEHGCPYQNKLQKIIKCIRCKELIYLPGNHSPPQRIQHLCPDGREIGQFRLSGEYQIIYEKPEK
ncbi:MAG: hypothetical protein U9R08_02185 [Nanoarchaeota archaeon]|nr:hypothetical protein [Nanoarchaeota archaeon]